jgi:hypothetical protein
MDVRFQELLISKSLECAERSKGTIRDIMLAQAARLEEELKAYLGEFVPKHPGIRKLRAFQRKSYPHSTIIAMKIRQKKRRKKVSQAAKKKRRTR